MCFRSWQRCRGQPGLRAAGKPFGLDGSRPGQKVRLSSGWLCSFIGMRVAWHQGLRCQLCPLLIL